MNISLGWVQTAVAVLTMSAMLVGVWSSNQSDIAVLHEKVASLTHPSHKIVTEAEWSTKVADIALLKEKVASSEKANEQLVDVLTNTHQHFTTSIDKLTEVLQRLSVNMAGVNARLTGVEGQLKEIRSKI